MPTGTGKTETMLALLTAVEVKRLMVVVPNSTLRDQIAEKFLTLGILKPAGVLAENAEFPVVATLKHRPKSIQEADDIFKRANVIVTTMHVAGQCDEAIQKRMAEHCSHLFIDEAQDIAPVALRMCVRLAVDPNNVFVTADRNPVYLQFRILLEPRSGRS